MPTNQTANQTASYKGRTYRLLWIGNTKFGKRAKLGFFDGSKEFWVDASAVSISSGRTSRRRVSSDRCRECGGPLVSAPHHAAMGGLCGHCAFDEYDC